MIEKEIKIILSEINKVLMTVSDKEVERLIDEILETDNIVTIGAGRVGMAIRGFCMRLGHLGYRSYHLGDTTLPSIGKGDLLIVASGSGETQTIYDLLKIGKKNKAKIALVTGNKSSRMAKRADIIVELKAPSKTSNGSFKSVQPMTTLNEQCLGILFDAIVLKLMEKMDENHDTMWKRHSSLE